MIRRTFIYRFFSYLTGTFYAFFSWPRSGCHTDSDVEGPFHRSKAPFRKNLSENYENDGRSLLVSGYVYQSDCESPLVGAIIDIWHASPHGAYDMSSDQYLFRGRLKTDYDGYYEFSTLMPKGYKDGSLDRPRHIHYKISAPGYQNLTTQLYFAGDAKLAGDPFVLQNNGLERAVNLRGNSNGELEGTFDIYMRTL